MNPMHTIRFETDCPGDTIHLHDEMELLYTLQGRCAVFADGKNFVLGKEDFAVFNPFSSHQLYREEGAHTLSLYIPIQLLNQAEIGTIYCISPLQPEMPSFSTDTFSKPAPSCRIISRLYRKC